MRDPDAVQRHESDQQQLLERIQQEVFELEEVCGRKQTAVGLILAAINYLAPRGTDSVQGQVAAFFFISSQSFFADKVVKPVQEFTNNEEEQLVLIARFLEWLVASFTHPFKSALLSSQISKDST